MLNWFEIPVKKMDRATKFYSSVLDVKLDSTEFAGNRMAMFEKADGIHGALVEGEGYEPSTSGSLLYLDGGADLSRFLNKVEKAGGKVLLPKTSIGPHGHIGIFLDTEGNRVAFHQNAN